MQDLLLGWFAFNQFFLKIEAIKKNPNRLGGEIGRHAGLKIQ